MCELSLFWYDDHHGFRAFLGGTLLLLTSHVGFIQTMGFIIIFFLKTTREQDGLVELHLLALELFFIDPSPLDGRYSYRRSWG